MKLLERRRNLIGAFARFIRFISGKPPLTLEACVNDKSTVDYKLYGESFQGLYQQVEYVAIRNNDGYGYSNHLDTGVSFSEANKIEFKISSTDTRANLMLVCADNIYYNGPYFTLTSNGQINIGFDTFEATPSDIDRATISDGNIHEFQLNYSTSSSRNIWFGSWNDVNYSRTIRWYNFKIYKDDILIRNFIPCYRKSDNVIGFYDDVGGQFYEGNQAFAKGNDITVVPTPNAPIEVESVGEKTINLFNPNEAILNGGTIDGDTIISTNIDYYLKAGTYTISLIGDGFNDVFFRKGQVSSGYFGMLSNATKGVRLYFTFTEDEYLRISHFATGKGIKDVMLVEGKYTDDTMPDYEPYGKYKIPIKASGKNLFDEKKLTELGLTLQEDGRYYDYSTNSYTLWKNTNGICGSLNIRAKIEYLEQKGFELRTTYTDGTYMWGNGITNSSKTVLEIKLVNSALRETWISNVLITTDLSSTDYEPYQEPITTNIYLDEPLRKIGDYADYIDFENQVVVRNIAQGYITGAGWTHSKTTKHICMTTAKTIGPLKNTPILCGFLPNDEARWRSTIECAFSHSTLDGYLYTKINWNRLGLICDGDTVYVDGDETQTALTEAQICEYFNRFINSLSQKDKILFAVKKLSEKPIELPQLPTFKGTTSYSVDTNIQPSNMEVTYYSKERSVS